MNYNFRFFDILNCMLLGAISLSIVLFSIYVIEGNNYFTYISSFVTAKNTTTINVYAVIIGLATIYALGLFINSLIDKISSRAKNIHKEGKVKFILKKALFHDINESCESIKRNAHKINFSDTDYPSWVYFSKNPYRVLSVLIERISQVKDENILNEYRYLNEFFQGVFYVVLFCIVYILFSILISCIDINHSTNESILYKMQYTMLNFLESISLNINEKEKLKDASYILFLIIACFLCGFLAKYYAHKLIKYISSCVEAHNVDINDIILENGMPTACILMKIDRSVSKEKLDLSLKSINIQSYQKIKIIMFIYGKLTSSGMKDKELIDTIQNHTNDTSLEVIKYVKEGCNKASAALLIRKIFVDIAQEDDVAIFLDPNDELSSKHSVSTIMKKFSITEANICLLNFTETESLESSLVKEDKIIYDNILKYIEKSGNYVCFSENLNLHAAMTLNCVKAYKKDTLQFFVDSIQNFDENSKDYMFSETGSYASFIDFFSFLYPNIKITAISCSTHNYTQYSGKHDIKELKKFFDDRIKSLDYLINLSCFSLESHKSPNSEEHSKCNLLIKFINYLTQLNNKYYKTKCKLSLINEYYELQNRLFEEFEKYLKFKLYVITLLLRDLPFNVKEENYKHFKEYLINDDIDKYKYLFDKIKEISKKHSKLKTPNNKDELQKFFEETETKAKNNLKNNF